MLPQALCRSIPLAARTAVLSAPRRATALAAVRRIHNQRNFNQRSAPQSVVYELSLNKAALSAVLSIAAGFATAASLFQFLTPEGRIVECEAKQPPSGKPAAADAEKKEGDAAVFSPMGTRMEALVRKVQHDMVEALERVEGPNGARFVQDTWTRKEGGFGQSCVLQEGKVFEKAGVNVSVISSPAPKAMLAQMRARRKESIDYEGDVRMFVAGVSMVIHPHNPMAPTFHANYRYFELRNPTATADAPPLAAWFGGGCDLTPSYLFEEDAMDFHRIIRNACDRHDPTYYPRFKKWCDDYFNNTHRGERRGIGGIFFDDLEDKPLEKLYSFVSDCANSLVHQYVPIVQRRKDMPFTPAHKIWQQLRRGRYVEFNLVHDRGTKFGLATPGVRIENVLMSLPLTARWEYNHTPEPNSPEAKLIEVLKNPREWA